MITAAERAGHLLRTKATRLAEAIVTEQYLRQPELTQRYGPDGRRYCVRDVGYHLDALAASVDLANPGQFVEYVRWARGMMAEHRVPAADFLVSLQVTRDVMGDHLPADAAELARRHLDAALTAWDT
jgi:hypothetical protein